MAARASAGPKDGRRRRRGPPPAAAIPDRSAPTAGLPARRDRGVEYADVVTRRPQGACDAGEAERRQADQAVDRVAARGVEAGGPSRRSPPRRGRRPSARRRAQAEATVLSLAEHAVDPAVLEPAVPPRQHEVREAAQVAAGSGSSERSKPREQHRIGVLEPHHPRCHELAALGSTRSPRGAAAVIPTRRASSALQRGSSGPQGISATSDV